MVKLIMINLIKGLLLIVKMTNVLVTIKIMPEDVDSDLDKIGEEATKVLNEFGATVGNIEKEPVAFGLVALKIFFSINEKNSNLDPLEEGLKNIDGVISADVVDVRREIG